MKSLLSLFLIFAFVNLYPQSAQNRSETNIILFPQGFGIEQLNSKGTSALLNNVANINGLNPAAINQFENLSLGVTYQFQTDIPEAFVADIGLSRAYNYLPQSFGGVYRIDKLPFGLVNRLTLGLGFAQRYNGILEMKPIPITTINQPDGTGEFITYNEKQMLQYYSLISAFTIQNFFDEKSELTIGFKYNLNRFSERVENSTLIEGTVLGSNFEAGINYVYNFKNERNISFGVSYKNKLEMKDQMRSEGETVTGITQDTSRGPTYYTFAPLSVIVKFPAEINFDLIYQHSSGVKITGSLRYINWSEINSNVNNQPEYSLSLIYPINGSVETSIGFYHSDYTYKENLFSLTDQMEALYLTAGLSFNIQLLNIDVALADSHFYSASKRKQTIGRIGIGIVL
jgi:hypothetical protein